MAKFRKKPVVIEALHFIESEFEKIENFLFPNGRTISQQGTATGKVFFEDLLHYQHDEREKPDWVAVMYIKTLEGDMKAKEGDWIIKGVSGEYYPCKPDIFEKTYELAD